MAWRLHLTNRAIHALDIIDGEPSLLAAWSRRDRVDFYNLETGLAVGEKVFTFADVHDRENDSWQNFLHELKAPNGEYLPVIHAPGVTIYTTDDGRMHLYHMGGHELYLENDGQETQLPAEDSVTFIDLGLDRFLALIVALDANCKLHVYQQHIAVGTFDLDLPVIRELRPTVAISRGGGSIFATNGRQIVLTDSSGGVRKRIDTHYDIRRMTCSPDGAYLVTCDMDTGVIRVYDGRSLTLSYQRFAVDLMAEATQVQLLADLPPEQVAPSWLAINDEGVVAFAMSGVLCVSDLTHMNELPRPQALL